MEASATTAVSQYKAGEQIAWSVRHWCAATDLSASYVWLLIAEKRISSVKTGNKRLILTSPQAFLESLATDAA
jgi:hypothetical protein